MRVAFLSTVGQVGGAELSLLDLLAGLPHVIAGFEPHVIVGDDGPLVDRIAALGGKVQVARMPPAPAALGEGPLRDGFTTPRALWLGASMLTRATSALGYAAKVRDLIRRIGPALVHSNGIKMHVLSGIARLDVPVLWHLRDFLTSRRLTRGALSVARGGVAGVIAISGAVEREARRLLGRVPVWTIHNGIDVARFAPAPEECGPTTGAGRARRTRVRVGLVATYARWKGQELFLDAISRMAPDPRVRFFVVGGPIYRTTGSQYSISELRDRARALGVAKRVTFLDFRKDTAAIYRALDVVVHASTEPEPFGRTVVEAMACGRAVIVSREGGAAELFTEGHDAVGFVPRDASSLSLAIGRLVADPELRDALGKRARQTALARFSRERLARDTAGVYWAVLHRTEPLRTGTTHAPSDDPIQPGET